MDNHQDIHKKHINKWFASILCGTILFIVLFIFMLTDIQKGRSSNELALSMSYSAFQSEVVSLIYDDVTLLKGYLTFIETYDMNEEMSIAYLGRLTGSNNNHYKSITIIEDTTIKWVYPRVGNEDTIGVDLASVGERTDQVLLVKEKRQPVLEGPLDLIQGGVGYVVRLPIILLDGSYWGQMGVVLDADQLVDEIKEIAVRDGLKVHISSLNNGKTIVEDLDVLNQRNLRYVLNENFINWEVLIVPIDGWDNDWLRITIIMLLNSISAFGVGVLVFFGLRTNENLKIIATKDSLSGLYNRYFLEDYQALVLSRADRYKKNVGFILIDLDRFKSVNDTYGHKVGDEVIRLTGETLIRETRLNEAAFRLGGDEFLVVFPDLKSMDELHHVESRLKQAFSKPFKIDDHDIQIIPSMGSGVYPRDGSSFDKVIHEADNKMYKNKKMNENIK